LKRSNIRVASFFSGCACAKGGGLGDLEFIFVLECFWFIDFYCITEMSEECEMCMSA
jgi:hypothetical protein